MSKDEETKPRLRIVPSGAGRNEDRCGFCGKPRAEVLSLVGGPEVFFCNDCVATYHKMLHKDA
ncbi:MAG TPA: ClpX C4-type zinc finger protein [Gammaproteobacteria bacterium]